MVAFYGMSDKLKDVSFYDSTGRYDYGFTKPYSDKTAEVIDQETQRIIADQMARAKKILEEHAEGHHQRFAVRSNDGFGATDAGETAYRRRSALW